MQLNETFHKYVIYPTQISQLPITKIKRRWKTRVGCSGLNINNKKKS